MLPVSIRNTLINSIKRINKERKLNLEREWSDDKIGLKDLVLDDLYNHFIKYKDQIVALQDILMPEPRGYMSYNLCTISIDHETLENKLGFKCPKLLIVGDDSKIPIPISDKVRKLWFTKQQAFTHAEKQYSDVTALAGAVINNFGSVKYLLTQFPELNAIFKVDLKGWKPNPHYRVPARNVFMNRDAFIHFLGGCTMDGVKL